MISPTHQGLVSGNFKGKDALEINHSKKKNRNSMYVRVGQHLDPLQLVLSQSNGKGKEKSPIFLPEIKALGESDEEDSESQMTSQSSEDKDEDKK